MIVLQINVLEDDKDWQLVNKFFEEKVGFTKSVQERNSIELRPFVLLNSRILLEKLP